ncbi:rCG35825, isoform CRA_a [Rattus norvegicus]|nr:rCG35825, isoform CRA_a [Rattus norvegicus]
MQKDQDQQGGLARKGTYCQP